MNRLQTLPKTERLHSRKLITELFSGGESRSMSVFPLRMVYMTVDNDEPCQMLISVPKRYLHRANKRNRVKRQVREAYRKHKDIVEGSGMVLAFIWLDNKLWPSADVERSVVNLLNRAKEKGVR